MTHWRFREEEAVSPQCLRTLSRVASFQSSTVSGPSLFRFGTKRFEGNELSSCLQFANFWFHSRCEMATSKGSPTRTSKVLCSKLLAPTFLPPISLAPQVQIKFWISEIHAIQILRKLWGLSFPTLSWSSRTWRSISHLRFRWELVESKQLTCTICLTNVNFQQVLDDKNVRRRFRASNYQSTTRWASLTRK